MCGCIGDARQNSRHAQRCDQQNQAPGQPGDAGLALGRPRIWKILSDRIPWVAAIARLGAFPSLAISTRAWAYSVGPARLRHRDLVAAKFALGADPPVQPPYRGMIEKQRLGQDLEKIDQEIPTPHMRQFMRDHRAQLRLREPCKSGDGQQDHRTHESDHRRNLKPATLQIADGAMDAETLLHLPAQRQHVGGGCGGLLAALLLQKKIAAGEPEAEQRHAGKPALHQERQQGPRNGGNGRFAHRQKKQVATRQKEGR